MAKNRQYDHEYKVQAVKLAKEIGQAKAVKEVRAKKHQKISAKGCGCRYPVSGCEPEKDCRNWFV